MRLLPFLLLTAACTSGLTPTQELASPAVEATASPRSTQTLPPSRTPTPTLPIQFIPWPEQGNLLLPAPSKVTFEKSLESLPSGGYLLRWDSQGETIQAVSFPQREVTVLARAPGLYLFYGLQPADFAGSTYVSSVGGPPPSVQVFDLRAGRTWRLSPLCAGGFSGLSPSGRYLLSSCEYELMPGVARNLDVFEVISVTDGTGFRVALPGKDEREPVTLSWLDEHQLIASRVWIHERFFVCLIDVEDRTALCPYSFQDPYVVDDEVVTGEYLPFVSLDGQRKELIMPRACLTRGECEGIVELGEIPGGLYVSPSGRRILLYGAPSSDHTLAAFLEPPAWGIEPLIDVNGSYVFDAWCPDETCIFLEQAEIPRSVYRLDPDGRLTFYPYDNIIASFNVP